MDTYRHAHQAAHTRTSHLTKLYSDTKKSALTSINTESTANEQFPALHRKYRIQKDRFITWGLAWSDEEKGSDGDIDDAVAKAGLTETVDSVLRNIRDVIEEVEGIQQASLPSHIVTHAGDKVATSPKPATFDQPRYEDLLKDLTASIDTLYDLSRSRRALARGEHPSFTPTPTEKSTRVEKPTSIRKDLFSTPSIASSEATLVNPPSFRRPSLSPYAGLPPRIELAALRLPEEGPPPYEALGVPSTTRLVAELIRAKASEGVQNALGSSAAEVPVLVEYANFDSIYRDTHVPPPLQRLEVLAGFFQPVRPESQTNLSLIGYFEDPSQPRIGLVYDVPYAIQNRLQGTAERAAQVLAPASLMKLVQKTSKTHASNGDVAIPALEHRFRLALRLVEQLHSLHAHDVPHGNINSSSVIFTMMAGETLRPEHMRSPVWASFDLFSNCSVEGLGREANLNVFRHPDGGSHGSRRDSTTDIRYDLYSLALVLLEIGLWIPISDLYKPRYTLGDFKDRIERLWIPKLAAKCGSAYMNVVYTCIQRADDPELSGIMTNAFYEDLFVRLRRCCTLDEDDWSVDAFPTGYLTSKAATPSYREKPLEKEHNASSEPSPLTRQQSEPSELLRSHPVGNSTPSAPHRLLSMPNLAPAAVSMAYADTSPITPSQISRQPSTRSHLLHRQSISQVKERIPTRITATPSFKEYKRKVTLIQQKWREHKARCHRPMSPHVEHPKAAHEGHAISDDNESAIDMTNKPKRQAFRRMDLPDFVKDEWDQRYAVQLARLTERALGNSTESSHIGLTMYGETPETARPTFVITCKSTAKVKQVIKRYFKYDAAIYDVRVKRTTSEIRRCRRSKRHGDSAAYRSMAPMAGCLDKAANPDYQERPLCGASIGAYRDDEHLPPVSFGGVVLVDGIAYGMSVHHMLEPNDDEDEEEDAEAGASQDSDSDTSSIRSSDNISIYSHSDDESTVRPRSTVSDDDDPPSTYEGDVAGIDPNDLDEEIAVTQPALDDAIECDLHVDEDDEDEEDSGIDEDHLLSYKLGQVHASSGLRRSVASTQDGFKSIGQSLPQEIDWALFELVPPRVHPYNIVKGGTKYCTATRKNREDRDSYPVAIKQSSDLACAKVHCIGRTSGLASGVISSTMELVKIHGRSTFSASWTVDGDFGVGGDSGAWVISNDDGRVCGHVLASKNGRTFICPMDLLLNDIKETLGASHVTLPSSDSAQDVVVGMSKAQAEQAVEEALGSLRLDDKDGGVALPVSPVRRSMGIRPATAVETAG